MRVSSATVATLLLIRETSLERSFDNMPGLRLPSGIERALAGDLERGLALALAGDLERALALALAGDLARGLAALPRERGLTFGLHLPVLGSNT